MSFLVFRLILFPSPCQIHPHCLLRPPPTSSKTSLPGNQWVTWRCCSCFCARGPVLPTQEEVGQRKSPLSLSIRKTLSWYLKRGRKMESLPISLQLPHPVVHAVEGQGAFRSSSPARVLSAAPSLTGLPQIAVFNVQLPGPLRLK